MPRRGQLALESGDQQRSIVLAAGLACRDEDAGGHFFLIAPVIQALVTIITACPQSMRAHSRLSVKRDFCVRCSLKS
jgi:hypothetical protein